VPALAAGVYAIISMLHCTITNPLVTAAHSSNCSSERSLSQKHIKSTLRSAVTQERTTNFALLNIEGELFEDLEFSDIIDAISTANASKNILT